MASLKTIAWPPHVVLTYHGAASAVDEEMTASLENTIVLVWVQAINPGLPELVKQQYGPELRNKTLAFLEFIVAGCWIMIT